MRLWHQNLIEFLPRQQLLGQHRECCALRGKGWGKKHSVVDYVFTYNPAYLVAYHQLIINEMEKRGYRPDPNWKDFQWRGNVFRKQDGWAHSNTVLELILRAADGEMIFEEHNEDYLNECLTNLRNKGVYLEGYNES